MKKFLLVLIFVVLFAGCAVIANGLFTSGRVRAIDPIDELEAEKNELAHLLKMSADATTPLEKQVSDIDSRIKKAQADIKAAKNQANELSKTIDDREIALGTQYKLFADRVAAHYKNTVLQSPLLLLLASNNAVDLTRQLAYQENIENRDNQLIHATGNEIRDLENQKKDLEVRQKRLASLQVDLDKQAEFFRTQIQGAKKYQQELSGKIAAISAKQQDILNARSGAFTTSVGDVPLADDFNASIAFKAQAPGNSFAVFSIGAYTHRNGMSQYGAKARAEAGQSVEDILKAYYPGTELKKDYNEMGNIDVQGTGSISFEDQYLQGIAEMPSSWNINALKAQAIAARTFAIRYTDNGKKSICVTEACQVFRNSKKGGDWEKAVNETKGWVLVKDGGPASTQYASTHGGYSNTGGWDTTDGQGGSDWLSRAWESKAKSPWVYKSWYRQSYSSSSASCGRSHPWLSQEEFSDIINAWIVRKDPKDADTNRIVPITINSCNIGGGGGNPYSMEELRNYANNSGGAVTSVSSVTVSNNNSGQSTNVHLQTNRGGIDIPASEFKTTFNLRAPGFLSIPQKSFAFFNIEHKE